MFKGKMNYAELTIKGKSKKEIFLCSYICHPSMANNELSGPLLSIAIAKYFKTDLIRIKVSNILCCDRKSIRTNRLYN